MTEFETIDGVVVKKEIMPSVKGLVALWTIFCKKPEIASSSIWVKPPVGVEGTIGVMLIWPEVRPEVGVLKTLSRSEEITAAPKTTTKPRIAFLIVVLACSKLSGFPVEVI